MINTAIKKVSNRNDLNFNEMSQVMNEIMNGEANNIQIASLLTALTTKHETIDEIAGAAYSMRQHAAVFPKQKNAIDIVGTGGDQSNSFNISTTTGLIIASLGIPVVKHGNRAASSKSGAADMIQALGINIELNKSISEKMLNQDKFCFLFAQKYHQEMKYVAPIRKHLGIRTIFNILGPLANPAHVTHQVLGVYDESLLIPLAKVLKTLNINNAKVIFGTDKLDEASISAPTKIINIKNGQLNKYTITPEEVGLKRAKKSDIVGGNPKENAQITNNIINGNKGPKRDIVLLNAGIAINTFNPQISIKNGVQMAANAIDNGQAKTLLNKLLTY